MYQTFIRKIRIYKNYSYICGSFIKNHTMKNRNKFHNIGGLYTGLTVLATLFLAYLQYFDYYPVGWVWVFFPLWGSLCAALSLIGLCFLILAIWGNDRLINADYSDKPKSDDKKTKK